jgi:hypothetical protein
MGSDEMGIETTARKTEQDIKIKQFAHEVTRYTEVHVSSDEPISRKERYETTLIFLRC